MRCALLLQMSTAASKVLTLKLSEVTLSTLDTGTDQCTDTGAYDALQDAMCALPHATRSARAVPPPTPHAVPMSTAPMS